MLLSLALGAALAAMVSLAGTAQEAKAASSDKIVFASDRTKGQGVNNPTGDVEIFVTDPKGTTLKQLTKNAVDDFEHTLTPDGTKIAYQSKGTKSSNPERDSEIYLMNVDGSGQKNLSNNGVDDSEPTLSPNGQKVAYQSSGRQSSNPEGDAEIYLVNASGSGKTNLTNDDVDDLDPLFSPDGTKIAYTSRGDQASNPQGYFEVYIMNAVDGSGQINLSNNGLAFDSPGDFSPDGKKLAYESSTADPAVPDRDHEVYVVNANGSGNKNLTNNDGIEDLSPVFSPDGKKIAYTSIGAQTSNSEGDAEVYHMNALDGSDQKNLSNTGAGVQDFYPVFSPGGQKVAYISHGKQSSNLQGDAEIYLMNALDGSGQKNLTNTSGTVGDGLPEWGG